jgi:hypothetical protein
LNSLQFNTSTSTPIEFVSLAIACFDACFSTKLPLSEANSNQQQQQKQHQNDSNLLNLAESLTELFYSSEESMEMFLGAESDYAMVAVCTVASATLIHAVGHSNNSTPHLRHLLDWCVMLCNPPTLATTVQQAQLLTRTSTSSPPPPSPLLSKRCYQLIESILAKTKVIELDQIQQAIRLLRGSFNEE